VRSPPPGKRTGQRRQAGLQAPVRAGNPPRAHRCGNCVGGTAARIDSSGRICERAIVSALGWAGGHRLTFTADAGVVTVRRDPGGMVTLPASAYFTIPVALRHRCGMQAGDQVLPAALRVLPGGSLA